MAAFVAGGCSDVIVPTACGGSFAFVVTPTLQPDRTRPRYSWQAGPAFELRVSRAADPIFAAWRIAADDADTGFDSPVDHGTVPDGATFVGGDETTLSSGVRYCVTVTLLDGQEGTVEFQP